MSSTVAPVPLRRLGVVLVAVGAAVAVLLSLAPAPVRAQGAEVSEPAPEGLSTPSYEGAPYFAPNRVYTENFPDPSVVHDPTTGRYHAFATTTGGVNVPTMWSTDGHIWTARSNHGVANPGGQLHDALPWPLPPNWPYHTGDPHFVADLWAPGVGKLGSRWVMFYSLRKTNEGRRCLVYATSHRPDGPYGDPKELHCSNDPMGSVDPQPFTDPATGTTYLVWTDSGRPGHHGQIIWARPIVLTNSTTVAFTGDPTFLLESAPGWEQYVAENPSLVRLPDGTLTLFYSGNEWVSQDYATGIATCSGFGFSWAPRCTRTSSGPYANRRAGRKGIGGLTATRGPSGEILVVSHSWAEHQPAGYTSGPSSNQRRMTAERLHQVAGRIVVSGEPGPTAAPPPAAYVPRDPVRVLDTRLAVGTTMPRRLEGHEVAVVDLAGVTGADTTAVTLNVTVTQPTRSGFVTAHPCGETPNASNVNFAAGQTIADLVTVQVNASRRVCLYSDVPTHLVADLQGAYEAAAPGGFTGVEPARLVDTRSGPRVPSRSVREVQVTGQAGVPVGATAASLNLTAADASGTGWLTAWDCRAERPAVSNVNYAGPAPSPNAAMVPLSVDGTVCVYAESATHLVVDVFGFVGDTGSRFVARPPTRLLDTRGSGRRVGAEGVVTVPVVGAGLAPSGTTSVVVPLTATDPQGYGWLSVFPCSAPGSPGERTSNLNVSPGETRAAHVTVPVAPDGTVCIYTRVASHVLVDLNGSFA